MTRISMTFAAATMTISLAQVARGADADRVFAVENLLPKELLIDFGRDMVFDAPLKRAARN